MAQITVSRVPAGPSAPTEPSDDHPSLRSVVAVVVSISMLVAIAGAACLALQQTVELGVWLLGTP